MSNHLETRTIAQAFADEYGEGIKVSGGTSDAGPFTHPIMIRNARIAWVRTSGPAMESDWILMVEEDGNGGYNFNWKDDGKERAEHYLTIEQATDAAISLAMILKP